MFLHGKLLALFLLLTCSLSLSRIERLWRDVFGGVLDLFYTSFCNLEREGLLNPDEEIHMYALHWSFLPQLQKHLQFFKDGWNHHRLRTEGNQSPLQLWTQNQREGSQDPLQVCTSNNVRSKLLTSHNGYHTKFLEMDKYSWIH